MAVIGGNASAQPTAATAAAERQAQDSGRPVVIGGLTTATTTVTAEPGRGSWQSTVNVGPSTESCNSTYDTNSSAWLGVGFSVLSAMDNAASGHWSNFTFRLWEQSNSNDVDWKRFGKNPYLQVTYNDTPVVPGERYGMGRYGNPNV
jgi:hypothetical protein